MTMIMSGSTMASRSVRCQRGFHSACQFTCRCMMHTASVEPLLAICSTACSQDLHYLVQALRLRSFRRAEQ